MFEPLIETPHIPATDSCHKDVLRVFKGLYLFPSVPSFCPPRCALVRRVVIAASLALLLISTFLFCSPSLLLLFCGGRSTCFEFIRGLIHNYQDLEFLTTRANRPVIYHRDSENVTVIAGSTECLAGFVGQGMLTAAIWGDVSGSSAVSCFKDAIEWTGGSKGFVVVLENNSSAGHIDAASGSAECKVKTVTIGSELERRVLPENLLVFKVAGAAAALGMSLDLVAAEAQHASEMVQNSVTSLSTDDDALNDLCDHFLQADLNVPLNPESSCIILLVNGSRATSFEKLMTLSARIVKKMSEFGLEVDAVYSGSFFPFRDIEEIIMIRVDKRMMQYLDAPTNAPMWPKVFSSQKSEIIAEVEDSRYLSDFHMERHLGSGGFGDVTLCKHKLDRQQYAVKRVPSKTDRLIPVEVAALSRLNHKNVVRYHQAWIEGKSCSGLTPSEGSLSDVSPSERGKDETPSGSRDDESEKKYLFMQMEYCPSILYDVIEAFTFERHWAWKALYEIVSGLKCIHEEGFTHGDLTPLNIFLDSKNQIKIGDFGLALCNGGDGFDDILLSSANWKSLLNLDYRAPEIQESGIISEKVDMYSLGIIICQLFNDSARFPELRRAIDDMKMQRLPATLDGLRGEQPDLHKVLSSLTAQDPNDRPTAVEVLACLDGAGLHRE